MIYVTLTTPAGGGGGGGAPTDAQYIVNTPHVDLTAERVVTDNAEVTWDDSVAGQLLAVLGVVPIAKLSADVATQAELDAHAGAADPHIVYQLESEKGNANGYASLDGGGDVPDGQIPAAIVRNTRAVNTTAPVAGGGDLSADRTISVDVMDPSGGTAPRTGLVPDPGASAGTTKFLREDATWVVPSGGSGGLSAYPWPPAIIAAGATKNRWGIAGLIGGTNLTTLALTAGRLYAFPFWVPESFVIGDLGLNVSTLVAGNARMGVYADDGNGGPGALVAESSTGSQAMAVAFLNFAFASTRGPELLWLAMVASSASTVRAVPAAAGWPCLGSDNVAGTTSTRGGYENVFAFAALPDPFPTPHNGRSFSTAIPALYYRFD